MHGSVGFPRLWCIFSRHIHFLQTLSLRRLLQVVSDMSLYFFFFALSECIRTIHVSFSIDLLHEIILSLAAKGLLNVGYRERTALSIPLSVQHLSTHAYHEPLKMHDGYVATTLRLLLWPPFPPRCFLFLLSAACTSEAEVSGTMVGLYGIYPLFPTLYRACRICWMVKTAAFWNSSRGCYSNDSVLVNETVTCMKRLLVFFECV
jgi:hypothetical protein